MQIRDSDLELGLAKLGLLQGVCWEILYMTDKLPKDWVRVHRKGFSCYYQREAHAHRVFLISTAHGQFQGEVIGLDLTKGLKGIPEEFLGSEGLKDSLLEILKLIGMPYGYSYHHLCKLKVIQDKYTGGPSLYAGWDGGEFITLVDATNWEHKLMHLDTLVSVRDYLPGYVRELLYNIVNS